MLIGKLPAVLAAALLISVGARAGDSGFYLGASVGEATQSSSGFDGKDTAVRWLAGYSFSKYFAAEAGFVDGGTQKDTIDAFVVKSANDGVFATALARLPLGRIVAPYAKLGYVFYDSRTTVSSAAGRSLQHRADQDLLYGAGLDFRIGERFRLRADYEKVDVTDVAFDIYSLVATFQF